MEPTADILDLLRGIDALSGASEADLQELVVGAEKLQMAGGEDLFREGSESSHVYILLSGELSVTEGDGPVKAVLKEAGTLLGEISAVSFGKATATVKADSEIQVIAISRELFHQVMGRSPQLASSVLRSMTKYL
ncbi:MAG: cyclic nucleotide-binding domain-containing protein [Verrucomicrobiota bacterium]